MIETVDLKSIKRRPQQYWNVDGLPELVMGLVWIVWGGAWIVGQAVPHGKVSSVYWALTPVLLVLSGLAATWVIKTLKARITFPRTGYVEWKEPTLSQRLVAAGVAMVAGAAMVGLVVAARRVNGLEVIAAPGMGVLLAVGFALASVTQRAPHLLALGGVALVLGFVFGALHAGWESMNWMLVALGAATMIVGAVRLRMFLSSNPVERLA